MKTRLLIATDSYAPRKDGVSRFLSELIPRLARHYNVTVVAPHFPGKTTDIPGVKIVRLPLLPFRFGDIQFARFEKKIILDLVVGADLVFSQSIGPIGMMTINQARKSGVPAVAFIHSVDWELASKSLKHGRRLAQWYVKRLARKLYNKCTRIIVPGDEISTLLQHTGVTTHMEKAMLGVDTTHFMPSADKHASKTAVGIDPYMTVIGFVGRIAREKNLGTLQKAFDEVHAKYTNTILLIVGEGLRDEIRIGPDVMVTGMIDDVNSYLQAMDIYVSPSLTETSSLATMEAMACALPVIVTPVGSIPDYVMHEKNGWFFSRRDASDLGRKITYLIEKPALRSKLGVNARRTIEQQYNWNFTSEKIHAILNSCVRKR